MKNLSVVRYLLCIFISLFVVGLAVAQQKTPSVVRFVPQGFWLNILPPSSPIPSQPLFWLDKDTLVREAIEYSIQQYALGNQVATYTLTSPVDVSGSLDLFIVSERDPAGSYHRAGYQIGTFYTCPDGFYFPGHSDQCLSIATNDSSCPTGTIYDETKGCVVPPPLPNCTSNIFGVCEEPNKGPTCEATDKPIHLGTGISF